MIETTSYTEPLKVAMTITNQSHNKILADLSLFALRASVRELIFYAIETIQAALPGTSYTVVLSGERLHDTPNDGVPVVAFRLGTDSVLQVFGEALADDAHHLLKAVAEIIEAALAQERWLNELRMEMKALRHAVSHDLRPPLWNLDKLCEELLQVHGEAVPPPAHDLISQIRRSSHDMEQRITAMVRLADIGQRVPTLDTVDLTELAQDWCQILHGEYPEHAVSCHVEAGLTATGDIYLLDKVFEQLMRNAFKLTQQQPDPQITVGRNDEGVFYVQDNGAGFNMRYEAQLFEPFQKLHSDPAFDGDGIGLAIVRRIIHLHDGYVWADSHGRGQGAIFYFILPDTPSTEAKHT